RVQRQPGGQRGAVGQRGGEGQSLVVGVVESAGQHEVPGSRTGERLVVDAVGRGGAIDDRHVRGGRRAVVDAVERRDLDGDDVARLGGGGVQVQRVTQVRGVVHGLDGDAFDLPGVAHEDRVAVAIGGRRRGGQNR